MGCSRCYDLTSREQVPIFTPTINTTVQEKNSSKLVVNLAEKAELEAVLEPKLGPLPNGDPFRSTTLIDTSAEDGFSITVEKPSTRPRTTSTTPTIQLTTSASTTTSSTARKTVAPDSFREIQPTTTSIWNAPVNTTLHATSTGSSAVPDVATGRLSFPLNASAGSKVISAELVHSSSPRSVLIPRKTMGGLPNRLRYLAVPQTTTSSSPRTPAASSTLTLSTDVYPSTETPPISSRITTNTDMINRSSDNNMISIFVEQEPFAQKKMEQSIRSNRVSRM